MKIRNKLSKRKLEKLLEAGAISPVPYSNYFIFCYKKKRIEFDNMYEVYEPDGKGFRKLNDVGYFQ